MDGMKAGDTMPRIFLRVERYKDGRLVQINKEIGLSEFRASRINLADIEIDHMLSELSVKTGGEE